MTTFEIIKTLCIKNNITLYKLEKECGLSVNSVLKWQNSSPKAENLQKIADYFNVTVDYLLGREQKDKPISEDMSFERFSNILKEKGLANSDFENLSSEQLSTIAEIIKNFKK